MVLIRPGRFLMGSPKSESDRAAAEGPRHGVTLPKAFAIGRCEVTVGEFRAFVDDTRYETDAERGGGCYVWESDYGSSRQRQDSNWRDPGFEQADASPVVCVSWNDARAYAHWLSLRTGERYRLPTEAEWEYAARAGTDKPFWTGRCIDTDQANYDGTYDYNDCGAKTGLYRQRTVSAGSLPANPWGLYEVAGNAWEWVADCWHDGYAGAPFDGRGWGEANDGDCARRVVRGGGWYNAPRILRSALRSRDFPDVADFDVGFRLARTL